MTGNSDTGRRPTIAAILTEAKRLLLAQQPWQPQTIGRLAALGASLADHPDYHLLGCLREAHRVRDEGVRVVNGTTTDPLVAQLQGCADLLRKGGGRRG